MTKHAALIVAAVATFGATLAVAQNLPTGAVVLPWSWEPPVHELVDHVAPDAPATTLSSPPSLWVPTDITLTWNLRRDRGEDSGGSYAEGFDATGLLEDSDRRWDTGTDEGTTNYVTARVGWAPADALDARRDAATQTVRAAAQAAEERSRRIERVVDLYERRRILQAELVGQPPGPTTTERVARIALLNARLDLLTSGWWTCTLRTRRPPSAIAWLAGLSAD